ncbi:DPH4 homolog [Anopheles moucheti]|uniref:DPH4 homolog n=1 Tax=Anopheles moucheti TaxID=186751 RepID=UPI0022F0DF70|nr:DPH4 homolog [Anopheles moucheti]XP_052902809.1 DPH4 homolog [Anopheles moucheti]XP_052902810.1 DPH4 homolog [Anopheles moucheti]
MSQTGTTVERKISHYEILQVPHNATLEEIRRSYQALALQYHPDKRKCKLPEAQESGHFIRIDQAWKTLRDDRLRRIYDAELMQQTEEYFVNEILTDADFERDEEGNFCFHTCRCGGYYILPEETPIHESVYVSCDECSLVVQVNLAEKH